MTPQAALLCSACIGHVPSVKYVCLWLPVCHIRNQQPGPTPNKQWAWKLHLITTPPSRKTKKSNSRKHKSRSRYVREMEPFYCRSPRSDTHPSTRTSGHATFRSDNSMVRTQYYHLLTARTTITIITTWNGLFAKIEQNIITPPINRPVASTPRRKLPYKKSSNN